MKYNRQKIAGLIGMVFGVFLLLGQGAFAVGAAAPSLDAFEFLATPEAEPSLDDVRTGKWRNAFTPHPSGVFRFGIINHPVWIRARIPGFNGSTRPVLTINSPGIKQADLFFPVQAGPGIQYRHLPGSLSQGLSSQDWGYRFMVFELPDRIASGEHLYFRFNPGGHTANFTMALADPQTFRRTTWMEMGILCLGIGILAGMILYNASLYLFLRDRNYLLYVIYISLMFGYQVCHSGIGRIAGVAELINASIPFSALTYIFAFAFTQQFLNTREATERLHFFLYAVMVLPAAGLWMSLTGSVHTANQITHVVGILGPVLMIITGVIRIRQGFLPARYYLAAWLVLIASIIILVLVGFGIVSHNFVTYNAHVLGSAVESILLSMALGDRMRMMRMERKKLQEHERRLTELSVTDELTGLFNKRGYAAKLSLEITAAREKGEDLSLLVLDVDRFKNLNDTYGHAAGDLILTQLGKIITQSTRNRDIPCRFGGEEFAVILPGILPAEARFIAERLRKKVETKQVPLENGQSISCTVSIGIAGLNRDDTEASLFGRADAALYRAKNRGRNQVMMA